MIQLRAGDSKKGSQAEDCGDNDDGQVSCFLNYEHCHHDNSSNAPSSYADKNVLQDISPALEGQQFRDGHAARC